MTPLITPDNRVILDLDVKKDSVGTVGRDLRRRERAVDRHPRDHHQVLVSDGQTVVLGGILETTRTDNSNKVPLLGDIPVLGNLFKTTTKINNKTELLIFITPKILREGVNVY